jgi:TP901-1 family phage major tail protein
LGSFFITKKELVIMAKVAGIDVLLYVDTDTTGTTPNLVVLGGQGDATLNREAEEVDVSAKTDGAYGDFLPGRKTWSIECEGFIVESDAAFNRLEDAYENREALNVEIRMPSGKKYSGEVVITEFPLEFGQEDGATFSLTLTGKGALTITPGT